jgi:uncharacterized protein YjdB
MESEEIFRPVTVEVSPLRTSLKVGETATLNAEVEGGDANTVRTVTWSALPTGIVSLTPSGLSVTVRATGSGTAIVTATNGSSGSPSGSAEVEVEIAVDSLTLNPRTQTVFIGESRDLRAMVFGQGRLLIGRSVTWQNSHPAVATVTERSNGASVLGVSSGTTVVRAASEGKSDSAMVTVPAPTNGRYAYALADNPTAFSYTVAADKFYNSSGQSITITRTANGRYQVSFSGNQPPAGQTQNFQVTALGTDPVYCKIAAVTTTATAVVAAVSCYDMDGDYTDQAFTILMPGSGALPGRYAFGWADQPTGSGYTPSAMFNATGQNLVIRRQDEGAYTVTFAGAGRVDRDVDTDIVLVTAAGPGQNRCTPVSLMSVDVLPVHCATGSTYTYNQDPDDAGFMTALLERGMPGKRFAYAYVHSQFTAPSTRQTYTSNGGAVEVTRPSAGRIDITFRGLGRTANNGNETAYVVAEGNDNAFCKLVNWQTAGADLTVSAICYSEEGQPVTATIRILVMQ